MNISFNSENLSSKDKVLINYIMENIYDIPYMSIEELSSKIGVSIATMSRLCKKLGYKSFKNLKNDIHEKLDITPASKVQNTLTHISEDNIIEDMFLNMINNLQLSIENLDKENFKKAALLILNSSKVYIFSPGPSLGLAYILKYRLNRFRIDINIIENGGSNIYESLVNLTSKDVVLVFGFSKMLVETEVVLNYSKEAKYKTILFTDLFVSEMLDMCNISLYCCRGKSHEFHSMVSAMALVDCLIVNIAMEIEDIAMENLVNLSKLRKKYFSYIKR